MLLSPAIADRLIFVTNINSSFNHSKTSSVHQQNCRIQGRPYKGLYFSSCCVATLKERSRDSAKLKKKTNKTLSVSISNIEALHLIGFGEFRNYMYCNGNETEFVSKYIPGRCGQKLVQASNKVLKCCDCLFC